MALARFQRLANFTDGAGDHGVVVGEVEFGVDNITVTTGLFICAYCKRNINIFFF